MSAEHNLTEQELSRIREACFNLASKVNWTKTTDTKNIAEQVNKISSMTEEVFNYTISLLEVSISLGCNTEVIIRAVNYITGIHAVPSVGCDINWYQTTLHTLIELACPNCEIGNEDDDFIEIDIRKRVEKEI